MGIRQTVVDIARQEVKNQVGLKNAADRTLQYYFASTGQTFTVPQAKTISWCTYFVHWVLKQAGVSPLPMMAYMNGKGHFVKALGDEHNWNIINPWTQQTEYVDTPKGTTSTSRFMKHLGGCYVTHKIVGGVCADGYTPKGGDLYYVPKHQKPRKQKDGSFKLVWEDVHHIGLIENVEGSQFTTLDGNSGDDAGQGPFLLDPVPDIDPATGKQKKDVAGRLLWLPGKVSQPIGGGFTFGSRKSWALVDSVMELPAD